MLPILNALSTEPIDLTSATPSTSAFGLDNVELQATFGGLMASSMPGAQSSLLTFADETLPPGGNSLPGNKPVVAISMAEDIALLADEQGDTLAVIAADNEVQFDATDSSGSESGLAIQGILNPDTRRLVDDLRASGRMRDRMQEPLIPGNGRFFDSQRFNANRDASVNQQAGRAVRLAMPDRLAATEIIDSAATNVRPLIETFEASPKRTSVLAVQPTVVASDSIFQLQGASHSTRVTAPAAIQAGIDVPVLDDAWGDALNERVLWMAGKSIQKAEIRLNPADLGPIRVEVSVADDVAKVSFSAQNAMTREAIESAMPRLREMLSENGLSLANTDVSDTGEQQAQNASDQDALHGPSAPTDEAVEDGVVSAESGLKSGQTSALVDTFV